MLKIIKLKTILIFSLGLLTLSNSHSSPKSGIINRADLDGAIIRRVSSYTYKIMLPEILNYYERNNYTSFEKKKVTYIEKKHYRAGGFFVENNKGHLKRVDATFIVPPKLLTYKTEDGQIAMIKSSNCYKPHRYHSGILECLTNDIYKEEKKSILNSNNIMFTDGYVGKQKIIGIDILSLNKKLFNIYVNNLLPKAGYSYKY